MAQFLFSPNGAAYQPYFEFGGDLVCGEPAPDLLLQVITTPILLVKIILVHTNCALILVLYQFIFTNTGLLFIAPRIIFALPFFYSNNSCRS